MLGILDPKRARLPTREQDPETGLFLSALPALRNPVSRSYYDRQRAQGKHHNQALTTLARRRCDILYAMLRDGTIYQPPRAPAA
ncbi:hypothetical protein PSCLAVI8L_460020 [Pseudoclavibacter sp. 8L]|nr:hypothetical protein PSCLAVI8L_460020 [Pseudoclavibacter sp. 8L]